MTGPLQDRPPPPDERRAHRRYAGRSLPVDWARGGSFLIASLGDISEMGAFVRTDEPPPVGTRLRVRFQAAEGERLSLDAEVIWVRAGAAGEGEGQGGMGLRFTALTAERRERLVALVREVAFLPGLG